MNISRTAVLTVAALAASATAAPAASAPKITKSGVGAVELGATYKSLRADGLVGKIRHGCELGGSNTRSAPLRKPLSGTVNFTLKDPRKVTDITVEGGAKARGVGIGATVKQIKAKFPKAKVDHSTDETFELTLVRVPKAFDFGVSTKTKKTTLIGVPHIAFCE